MILASRHLEGLLDLNWDGINPEEASDKYTMQLVKRDVHRRTKHFGSMKQWEGFTGFEYEFRNPLLKRAQ